MPSGRLAFATRRVDLMAASMRAPSALCTNGMTVVPRSVGKKNSTGGSSSRSARSECLDVIFKLCRYYR